jgi:hypothetical protein
MAAIRLNASVVSGKPKVTYLLLDFFRIMEASTGKNDLGREKKRLAQRRIENDIRIITWNIYIPILIINKLKEPPSRGVIFLLITHHITLDGFLHITIAIDNAESWIRRKRLMKDFREPWEIAFLGRQDCECHGI